MCMNINKARCDNAISCIQSHFCFSFRLSHRNHTSVTYPYVSTITRISATIDYVTTYNFYIVTHTQIFAIY